MDGETFELCVEGFLAPTLRKGDIVILDDLAARRTARAAEIPGAGSRSFRGTART